MIRWIFIVLGVLAFTPYRILKVYLYLAPIQVYYEVVDLWQGFSAIGRLYDVKRKKGKTAP